MSFKAFGAYVEGGKGPPKKNYVIYEERHHPANVEFFICLVCNRKTSYYDTHLCYFLINDNKIIPVNGHGFLERCNQENWPNPGINFEEKSPIHFKIESWLFERAKDAIANIPRKKKRERRVALSRIEIFARSIGLKIDFAEIP